MDAVSSMSDFVQRRRVFHEAMECGTPHTAVGTYSIERLLCGQGIVAIPFAMLHALDVEGEAASGVLIDPPLFARRCLIRLKPYMKQLTNYAVQQLQRLRHSSGVPVVQLLGAHATKQDINAGPTVAFCVRDSCGQWLPSYADIHAMAERCDIALRAGCFCNVGACMQTLGLTDDDVRQLYDDGTTFVMPPRLLSGHACGEPIVVVNHKPTGALRVSFGPYTTQSDIDAFITFLTTMVALCSPWTYLRSALLTSQDARRVAILHARRRMTRLSPSSKLEQICIYPIKGCNGVSFPVWTVDTQNATKSLLWDRIFRVVPVTSTGTSLPPSAASARALQEALATRVCVEIILVAAGAASDSGRSQKPRWKGVLMCYENVAGGPEKPPLFIELPPMPDHIMSPLLTHALVAQHCAEKPVWASGRWVPRSSIGFTLDKPPAKTFPASPIHIPVASKPLKNVWVVNEEQFREIRFGGITETTFSAIGYRSRREDMTRWLAEHVREGVTLEYTGDKRRPFMKEADILVTNTATLAALECGACTSIEMERSA